MSGDNIKHAWPEEDEPRQAPPAPLGRRARIYRALGDIFLTGGMARSFTGRTMPPADRAATNVILFGEGDAKGRDATRGSDHR